MSHLRYLLEQLPKLQINPQFASFGTFPVEIRLNIWRLACRHPRIIMIAGDKYDNEFKDHGTRNIPGQARVPEVLQVNRESREEALKYYEAIYEVTPWDNCMAADIDELWTSPYPGNTIYVNFAVDRFLPMSTVVRAATLCNSRSFQKGTIEWADITSFDISIFNKIQHFKCAPAHELNLDSLDSLLEYMTSLKSCCINLQVYGCICPNCLFAPLRHWIFWSGIQSSDTMVNKWFAKGIVDVYKQYVAHKFLLKEEERDPAPMLAGSLGPYGNGKNRGCSPVYKVGSLT